MGDSIHALWVDPLAFVPSENGPPYLPEPLKSVTASASGDVLRAVLRKMPRAAMAELGALVTVLRAASVVHQSHHWQTSGTAYYGDHLLFDRLYNDSLVFIDQIAERAVGSSGPVLVDPRIQASVLPLLVNTWCQYSATPTPLEMVGASLVSEKCVLDCLETACSSLEQQSCLSSGTANLLQGVADKHEEFVYLLQQRQGGKAAYSYDSR